jgi:alcohol dehydrogenase class IV
MRFEFATATRIVFGAGVAQQATAEAACLGRRPLIVTGKNPTRAAFLRDSVPDSVALAIEGEPSVDAVREGAAQARESGCDVVIAIGGGSAIDAGKAIAALITNGGDPLDFLEIIGQGQPLERPSAPFIAIPTTAGTGSEVTRNAVLASREHRTKASLRSLHMLPRLAIVDPQLTLSLPPAITAATGLDALTQLIESYVSRRANPLTDAICVEGMRHAAQGLRQAYYDGAHLEARSRMSLASLFSGLALANAGLGAVHGFAAPIGGMFDAPHGAVCAALLPHVVAMNLRALRSREPDNPALQRYGTVARILTGHDGAVASDLAPALRELVEELRIPALSSYGVRATHLQAVAEAASRTSSMKGNSLTLTSDELCEVLTAAL